MTLWIIDDDNQTILFSIEDVEKAPYGIEVVNNIGGVALSPQLRLELTRFFYEGPTTRAPFTGTSPAPRPPITIADVRKLRKQLDGESLIDCKGNVVPFKPRLPSPPPIKFEEKEETE